MASILENFGPLTREWFTSAFEAPTPAQEGAWRAAISDNNALVVAPTGSGKTLAGFLWSIDQLAAGEPTDRGRLRVLYVSPLKALAVDIERNLRTPLRGMAAAATRLELAPPQIRVGVRTGDTPQQERRRLVTAPPDILITTPESLFLMLTSQAREVLKSIETVIVDEIHALAGNKRGAHLALSLERLDHLTQKPVRRLGLSATVRPAKEVAHFLGGTHPVDVVEVPSDKVFDLSVVVPVEDMTELGETTTGDKDALERPEPALSGSASAVEERTSIWPHVEERLLDLIRAHSSTIVFVNSRRLAERLCARLNELAEDEVARAHHGSVSKEQRKLIEEQLKSGRLPAVVATSSLELGIDMAAVDLVVQVEAPSSVSSGLQRIGRAGHHVGAVSRGIFFPKYRGDLLQCALVVERMKEGAIETIEMPRNSLDVLAQQIVAMVAMDEWTLDDLERVVLRAAPFEKLPRSALEAVLDMLSGRYPSSDFSELRPRIKWDRSTNVLARRPGAQQIAVTSGGTIPDRGLFGVFIVGERSQRVGELDEEMVYETRPGDTFILGSSTWLVEDITQDRVLVSPAPGQPGRMPFWHGDAPGRPMELGTALGEFVRELDGLSEGQQLRRLLKAGMDNFAATNLVAYLKEQKEATGALPDDRTIVVERFRDEVGDWRLCIHSPFGAQVHAPWSQAIEHSLRDRFDVEVQCIYTDDGIVVRLPDAEEVPGAQSLLFEAEDVENLVVERVGTSALFSSRFRECAGRALLLPRRRAGGRTPLWQQRQKSARLLQVASKYRSFPIVLETYRECLQDVFDLDSLVELMRAVRRREIRVVEVETEAPSPFASSLQFGFVNAFMYEGDAPLAERRAQALSLDRSLLAEIMGREELRELIDDESLSALELELQFLTDEKRAKGPDALHDLLRMLGDLSDDEVAARITEPVQCLEWLAELERSRRSLSVRIGGENRWIAAEDAGRYRDALGTPLPVGVPDAFLESGDAPLDELVARYARTHGPFRPGDVARRFSIGERVVEASLKRLEVEGRVLEGEFRPGGVGREWIEAEVLRRLRRRSLAAWRKEIEPAPPDALARFTIAWHGLGPGARRRPLSGPAAVNALFEVVEQLQGAPIPASTLEQQVLAARLPGYAPAQLDELLASGELTWAGAGPLGSSDGWVVLAPADRASLLLPDTQPSELSAEADAIRRALSARGALFFRQIADEVGSSDDQELLLALWELVWAGWVTNDTFGPVRAHVGGAPRRRPSARRRRPSFPARLGPPAAAGRWSLVGERASDQTRRAHAVVEQMLARHGIVTRGAVTVESVPGGFAGIYPVLKAMEESGRCRRGYFVDGLGGAQFALEGAVDRLRALVDVPVDEVQTEVLAATDPANPYGAALPWPERPGEDERAARRPGHRAGRKAGAVVVLVSGALVLYIEKGGKSLLSFTEEEALLRPAVDALTLAVRDGLLGRLSVERADGEDVRDSPLADLLTEAGFRLSARGLYLRA
ncbi:MAG: DEAD/DEAH box helicase [Actinomycetota bacterium]|nr:DEAD/DEAH box helicase [Actinomycetota bacterium]